MGIADDLRACECAGCVKMEQPRTDYCDRCGNDAFVPVVAELEAIVRELATDTQLEWMPDDWGEHLDVYDGAALLRLQDRAREATR